MRVKKKRKTYSRRNPQRKTYKRKRRNPMLLGNPRRPKRIYRRRRNPGFGGMGRKIPNILINGAVGVGGAMALSFLTKGLVTGYKGIKGVEPSSAVKNWLALAGALGMALMLPKLKLAGKYTDALVTGAVVSAGLNIASNTFGLKNLILSGEDENPELDRIIANLNVDGYDEGDMLLGVTENNMLGITETDVMGDMLLGEDEIDIEDEYDYI